MFRFSLRPNRAADINWQPWGSDAFAAASRHDKPVLLCLTAVWCHWCHLMDETTYSEPAAIELINENFVAIRVDADQFPHVHDRYIAGGWPTNAFLTPTGEVLWSGTYIEMEQFMSVAGSVRAAWTDRRAELSLEIERRRKALEAARGRVKTVGLVRRDAADDVWNSVVESFDAQNGGFGTEPKYPTPEAIELIYVRGRASAADSHLARQTLDGMLAGELWDPAGHGFFRYALTADWKQPQTEKLLAINAGLLRSYALGAAVENRADWRTIAEQIVAWAERNMRLDDDLWSASQAAAPEHYARDADERRTVDAPSVDRVLYANVNAQWLSALADAGGRLGRADWINTAAKGLRTLLDQMAAPNGLVHHYRFPGADAELPGLLLDVTEVARACIAVGQAVGDPEFIAVARKLVGAIEKSFWADDGGFYDRTGTGHDVGVLRFRDRPFDLNAELARVLLDLSLAYGERSYRALAERTLAMLSPMAGRFGVGGSQFALAVNNFFDAPVQLVVTGSGPAADELRYAALALPVASRRVWSLPEGGRIDTNTFPRGEQPTVYAIGAHGVTRAITDSATLANAVAHIV
jgi:uncharacterized protein YyaL (SSP411 family)